MGEIGGWHRRLIEEGPDSPAEDMLRALLRVPAALFSILTRGRAVLYRCNLLSSYRAPVAVISVGNLAVGGTGKTPVTDYLVKLLLARQLRVAVVSRGYGGGGVAAPGLVCAGDGPLVGAGAAGDEPYLLARRNPRALVFVNPRRREAVAAAVADHGAEVVLLDDGFQHLAVARDLDIVLLDAARPLSNGRVLPAGRLREPVSALQRADLLLLTRHAGGALPQLPVDRPVLACRHRLGTTLRALDGRELSLTNLAGRRGVAFAGIAHPQGFFDALTAAGLNLVECLALADHVHYDQALLERLERSAEKVEFLLTTEKDAVKLEGVEFGVPCYQVPLEVIFDDPERLAKILDNCLQGKEAP